MNDYLNITVKEFNQLLNKKMNQEEKIALNYVGR